MLCILVMGLSLKTLIEMMNFMFYFVFFFVVVVVVIVLSF